MSAVSHGCEKDLELVLKNPFKRLLKTLKGCFTTKNITYTARLYHGNFSYELVPDTAISSFHNMDKITSLYSGDCHVYVFELPGYQGNYWIIGPGETVDIDVCGSLIVSTQTFSIEGVIKNGKPPEWCWELLGPMYLMHFYSAYKI